MLRRYQLNKSAVQVAQSGHPWIFRDQMSSAADIFASGDLLELVDGRNTVVGYGVYEPEGLIAIRILRLGDTPPDTGWVVSMVEKALSRRENVRKFTNAFRAIHGENDGLPGIVVDVYDRTAVLQTYATSVDAWGRLAAEAVAENLSLRNVLAKDPAKRQSGTEREVKVLKGELPKSVKVHEGKLEFEVDLSSGQKSGLFLDLRHLRKWVASSKLNGKRVLNLFAYTGTLSLAAEVANAKEIWNVDVSAGALEFGKSHHTLGKAKTKWIHEDVFQWVRNLNSEQKFDLIIFDPPNMAADKSQVKEALAVYRRMYAKLRECIAPKGVLVACCCTSRIARNEFKTCVENGVQLKLRFVKSLMPEEDHPVGFPQGDYLKVLIYQAPED